MKILALETSTPFLVLGWLDGENQREQVHHLGRAHAEQISHYLEQFDVPRADLIAVGAGPGSYTGVRLAASFALGLARAWNAKVVRVPTLEAIATRETGIVAVSLNAFRGNVYSAVYKVGVDLQTLVPIAKRSQAEFQALIPVGAQHLEDIAPSGIGLAKLAQERLLMGQNLELLYL